MFLAGIQRSLADVHEIARGIHINTTIPSRNGFTLLECLVTLSIILILLITATPSLQNFFDKDKNKIMSQQLVDAIYLARSEAITRSENITLCKSADQKKCSGAWQQGYIIYNNEKILYSFQNAANEGVLSLRSFPNRDDLQFLPSGQSRSQNGTFWYCAKGATKPSWAIVMSQSGRVRVVYPDETGEIVDAQGKSFNCLSA